MDYKRRFHNKLSSVTARCASQPVAYKLLAVGQNWHGDKIVLMNTFPAPFKLITTTLLTGILVFIGALNLRDRATWTDPTDGIFWTENNGTLTAAEVDPRGPGKQAGISSNDRLVSINGSPVSSLEQYSDLIYKLGPGGRAKYDVRSQAGIRHVTMNLGSKSLLTPRDGLRTLLAFLHLGIGIFVLFRGDRLPRTFHFYLICLAAFVVYLFSYTPKLGAIDFWVYGLNILAFLLLPALFIHFCLRFPVDVVAGDSRVSLLYAPATLFVILQVFWMTGRLADLGLPRTAWASGLIERIQLAYFCIGFLAGAALLLKRHFETHELVVRQQMKWVSYGTLAAVVPFSLIYVVPWLFGAHSGFAMDSSILFLGLIPLSMGYALIHYRLMDVEVIVRRSAAYFIASSLLLAFYVLFVLVLGRALQWVAPQADFVAICFTVLIIALLFAPLRNAIQSRLDRMFYKEQFEDRSSLLEFARTLSSEISLVPLSRRIVERISKTFQLDKVSVYLSDPAHSGFFHLAHSLDESGLSDSRLYREDDLVDRDSSSKLGDPHTPANYLRRANPTLVRNGYQYLQDLKLHGRKVGMIALGQLPAGRHFSTEDLELLSALAGYAAMALENANLYQSVETKAAQLERLKAYTENIIESINLAVLALDSSGRINSCNRAFEELFETSRQQIVGSLIETLLPLDVLASIRNVTGAQRWELKAPANIFKLYLETQGGKKLIVNLSLIPLQDQTLKPDFLLVIDNVTEKVQLEDQLLQAEKLSSIGLLAAGIAHEVNTPIAGISSYTQMLLKDTPESDKRKQILEKIEKQTFRAAEIVNGLLNFSRLNGSEFKDLDINQLIQDSLSLLSHQFQINNIKVESRFGHSLPPVYGNMGKLQQVFINLFLNACDAMPNGGGLTVQTAMNESMVLVEISDTGIGISEENIKRIFDPFFTTKSIGKGTGLGLAVTYGIIQEHGGRIFVDSAPGQGTRFRLKFPIRVS
jgi:PAS domain S-box-containing protein